MKVNGSVYSDFSGSILQLLQQKNLSAERVAVEYNGDILPREKFVETFPKDEDVIEIVHFVGGG